MPGKICRHGVCQLYLRFGKRILCHFVFVDINSAENQKQFHDFQLEKALLDMLRYPVQLRKNMLNVVLTSDDVAVSVSTKPSGHLQWLDMNILHKSGKPLFGHILPDAYGNAVIVPQRKTEGAHHGFSQGDTKITRHEIEEFILKFLLNPPLPAVMDLDHISLHDIAKIKAIHMHRAVDQLHTGKYLIHHQFCISQVIGKAVFFLFNRLHFFTSFVLMKRSSTCSLAMYDAFPRAAPITH